MKLQLQITSREKTFLHELLLNTPATLGRRSKNSIHVLDPKMSGYHCRFILTNAGLRVFDLNSKNGIYLNSIKIEEAEIFVGDQLKMGDTLITIDEKNLDQEANTLLKFPGSYRARVAQEMEIDFTNVRNKNQLNSKASSHLSPIELVNSHNNEINLRKKIKSSIKLSKDEIGANHPFLKYMARTFDISFVLFLVYLTFISIDGVFDKDVSNSILVIEFSILFFLNSKLSKFTLGETFTGIKRKYLNQ